jgi:catechol 2,3-dioxygenase-like lactoylglutathione lyase family enzyme
MSPDATDADTPVATRILETVLYASDLVAAQRFYIDVFGLELIRRMGDRGIALRCGGSALLIFDPAHSRSTMGAIPGHGCEGAGHMAFVVPSESLDRWRDQLARHRIAIESEVDWPEGGRSIYVRDPAGNSVELAPPTIWNGLGARASGR